MLLMLQQMTRAWMPEATWSSDSPTGATNAGSAGLNDDQHWLEHSGNLASGSVYAGSRRLGRVPMS